MRVYKWDAYSTYTNTQINIEKYLRDQSDNSEDVRVHSTAHAMNRFCHIKLIFFSRIYFSLSSHMLCQMYVLIKINRNFGVHCTFVHIFFDFFANNSKTIKRIHYSENTLFYTLVINKKNFIYKVTLMESTWHVFTVITHVLAIQRRRNNVVCPLWVEQIHICIMCVPLYAWRIVNDVILMITLRLKHTKKKIFCKRNNKINPLHRKFYQWVRFWYQKLILYNAIQSLFEKNSRTLNMVSLISIQLTSKITVLGSFELRTLNILTESHWLDQLNHSTPSCKVIPVIRKFL